jgi:hypothetical protein
MAKVVLGAAQGVAQTKSRGNRGVEVVADVRNQGMSPYRMWVSNMTSNTVLSEGDCGVWVMSGSTGTGRLTATLPSASLAAGCMFIFRVGSADQQVITASQEAMSDKVNSEGRICFLSGSPQGTRPDEYHRVGSKLILPNISGSSAVLLCDGVNWNIIGGSGSLLLNSGSYP